MTTIVHICMWERHKHRSYNIWHLQNMVDLCYPQGFCPRNRICGYSVPGTESVDILSQEYLWILKTAEFFTPPPQKKKPDWSSTLVGSEGILKSSKAAHICPHEWSLGPKTDDFWNGAFKWIQAAFRSLQLDLQRPPQGWGWSATDAQICVCWTHGY